MSATEAAKIRVLRVVTRLNVGGPTRHVGLLAEALPRHGFEQRLVVGAAAPEEGEGRLEVPGEILRWPALGRSPHPGRDLGSYRELRRLIGEFRPGVVHTHQAKAGALGRLAAAREGVPAIVHTFHGHTFSGYWSRPVAGLVRAAERFLARRSHALIAQSPRQMADLEAALGSAARDRLVLVPPALPRAFLEGAPDPRARGRFLEERLGLAGDDEVLLLGLPARLVPIKRVDRALLLLKALRSERPAHLVVTGDGPLGPSLRAQVRALGLESAVSWLPHVADMKAFHEAMDLVLLTSANEGTPLVLLEALARGTPVAAPAVGGVPDVIGGEGCLLGAEEPPADWARRLMEWWAAGSAREAAARGRIRVRRDQDPERLARDLAALYRRLLDG